MNTTTTTTSTMNKRLLLNKKPSIYSESSDSRYLNLLSKAALLDLCVELLRAQAGECDTPLSAEAVSNAIAATIAARGDRLPNISK